MIKKHRNLGFYIQQKNIFQQQRWNIDFFQINKSWKNSTLAHPHEDVRYPSSKKKTLSEEYLCKEIKSSGNVNFLEKYVIDFYF